MILLTKYTDLPKKKKVQQVSLKDRFRWKMKEKGRKKRLSTVTHSRKPLYTIHIF